MQESESKSDIMATGSSPPDDLLTARIRHKLQQDQIKLWLPPYIDSSTGISVSSSLEVSSLFLLTFLHCIHLTLQTVYTTAVK